MFWKCPLGTHQSSMQRFHGNKEVYCAAGMHAHVLPVLTRLASSCFLWTVKLRNSSEFMSIRWGSSTQTKCYRLSWLGSTQAWSGNSLQLYIPFGTECEDNHCFIGSSTHFMVYEHNILHDDVIKWKHFPCYWPLVRGIHWSPVNSPHKGQWRGALMFSLICA